MKEIKCLIVDDEAITCDIIAAYISHVDDLILVASCANTQEAFGVLEKEKIDLIYQMKK